MQIAIDVLNEQDDDFLTRCLSNRTNKGYMILQDAIRTGNQSIMTLVTNLLLRPKLEKILAENLTNKINSGFYCMNDAIKSDAPEVLEAYIKLSEKHLSQKKWQELLLVQTEKDANYLQLAVFVGNPLLVELYVQAIHRAFGEESVNILRKMTNEMTVAFTPRTIKAMDIIKPYFNNSRVQNIERTPVYVRPTLRLPRLFNDACKAESEKEYKQILSNIKKEIAKNPQELVSFSQDKNWSHFNMVLMHVSKGQHDKLFAAKIVNELFNLLWEETNQRFPEKIEIILSAKKEDGRNLLCHAVGLPFEDIVKFLIEVYSQQGRETLLKETLVSKSLLGLRILQSTIISQSNANVEAILKLLEKFPEALSKNLGNVSTEGYMPVHEAVRGGFTPILKNLLSVLTRPPFHALLDVNLRNQTGHGFTLLTDVLKSGNVENVNLIIEHSEKYMDREAWKRRLKDTTHSGHNCLHHATNFCNIQVAQRLVDSIIDAFGNEASKTLDSLMNSRNKFRKEHDYKALHGYIKQRLDSNKKAHEKGADSSIRKHNEDLAQTPIAPSLPWRLEQVETSLSPTVEVENVIVNSENRLPEFDQAKLSSDDEKEMVIDHENDSEDLSNLKNKHHQIEEMPEIDVDDEIDDSEDVQLNQNEAIVSPCAGIDPKYLGGVLPALPQPETNDQTIENDASAITYLHEYELTPFKLLTKSKEDANSLQISLNLPEFHAEFYSERLLGDNEQVTFVLAGRKEEALLPRPIRGRCILVLTQEEHQHFENKLPQGYDALVIKAIQSDSHGRYQHLHKPTARRLGLFLFAHHMNLLTFMMIDDNIKKIKANCRNPGWDNFYELMKNQLDKLYCVSVRTDFNKTPKPGELGSKMFMIDMQALKERIPNLKNIFALFPIAANECHWGEDYWMQLAFYVIANFESQGYEILDKALITLQRSKSNQNAFANTGARARLFDSIDIQALQKMGLDEGRWVEVTHSLLNDIISENINRYQKRKKEIEKADLQIKHALANQITQLPIQSNEPQDVEGEFIQRYQSFIKTTRFKRGVFRHYQLSAMGAISKVTNNHNRLILATGAGKTYLQCELMRMAYHTAKAGEHIIVVTPHIELVNQFYNDFIEFNKNNSSTNRELQIPQEAIIKVCSHKQSCHVKTILMNDNIDNQKSVLIFCSDSLEKFVEEMNYQLPHVPLILLDEYHYYPSTVEDLINNLSAGSLIIGATATPPESDRLITAYRYTRAQGVKEKYLAPVIADSLSMSFSKENVAILIPALPTILQTQNHPNFREKQKLKDSKGIIYLPSIADCEQALAVLKEAGITAFCIHSKNTKHKAELEAFLENDDPGVLLAVKMLRIGFNAKDLGWTIIAQNAKAKEHASRSNIEQMIGRVMRLNGDKVGYVLCFKDVLAEVVKPLLASQPITQKVNPDYLAQNNVYFAKGNTWKICDVANEKKFNELMKRTSLFKRKFSITSEVVPKFQMESALTTHNEADEADDSDFLTMIYFGVKSIPLVHAFESSKASKGRLAAIIEEIIGDEIVPWTLSDSTNEHKASVRK
uniref:Type III restriction enzyme, res subunit n=1 Tax=Candidatus Berkiella aquae TaxID=295108 RepID=A0A0Q9YA79_9GAMM